MSLITPADLETNIYPEVIEEITRANTATTQQAIAAAEAEAKMYLGRYDLEALFGTTDTEPSLADDFLQVLVKDLACWHLLRLSGTTTDSAIHRTAYTDALSALRDIRDGKLQPPTWPYADPAAVTDIPDGNAISWSSNSRRTNHY